MRVEIDLDLIFLRVAAENGHVGDAGRRSAAALDHPVLQRLQLHHIHAGRAGQLITKISLMPPAGEMTGCTPVGQVHVFQPVDGLLTNEMIILPVFELQPDEAQRENGVRARELEPGRARDARFQSALVT